MCIRDRSSALYLRASSRKRVSFATQRTRDIETQYQMREQKILRLSISVNREFELFEGGVVGLITLVFTLSEAFHFLAGSIDPKLLGFNFEP